MKFAIFGIILFALGISNFAQAERNYEEAVQEKKGKQFSEIFLDYYSNKNSEIKAEDIVEYLLKREPFLFRSNLLQIKAAIGSDGIKLTREQITKLDDLQNAYWAIGHEIRDSFLVTRFGMPTSLQKGALLFIPEKLRSQANPNAVIYYLFNEQLSYLIGYSHNSDLPTLDAGLSKNLKYDQQKLEFVE